MTLSYTMCNLIICAYLGAVVCGSSGCATRVGAKNARATAKGPPVIMVGSATQGAKRLVDEELRERVQAALHSDPFFYDEHVTVSVENGNVVLQGFVSGPWDLLDAIRIARKAAGGGRVIDDLEILLGGGKK
jgi:osmotically-inducible protein OsmY